MDDKEYDLYEIDDQGEGKSFLSEITIPAGPSSGWLSDVRSYIQQMDLLEYEFNFWNASRCCRVDRKFEKAIKVKGNEIIVTKSIVSTPKKPCIDSSIELSVDPNLTCLELQSGDSTIRVDDEMSDDEEEGVHDEDANNPANTTIAPTTTLVVAPMSPTPILDRSVPPEQGGP
ncbi:unnamed protein product [Calypogeia fissa]